MYKYILFIRMMLISMVFLNIFTLNAQKTGVVADKNTNQPLADVNIRLQKDNVPLCNTDKKGTFNIVNLSKALPNDTIIFSYLGYQSAKCTLEMLKKNNFVIIMQEEPQRLQEVAVTAEKQSYFLTYTTLASLPTKLYSFGSFLSNGKIYVISGDKTQIKMAASANISGTEAWEFRSKDMYVYDIAQDKWMKKKQQLIPRSRHAAHIYKNKIFILGGIRYSTNRIFDYTDEHLEIYDMKKDTLYTDPVNPHQAVNFTSFIYRDYLYVIGGAVKEKVFSDKIHALDLKRGIWYDMGNVPEENQGQMNGVLVGHTVYFFGGYRVAPLWTIKCYDLETGRWQYLRDLKEGVSYPGLAVNGHLIYIYENNTLQVYDINDNSLRSFPINLDLDSAGLYYYNNKLYIVGGCYRDGIYISPNNGVYCIDIRQINVG